MTKVYTLKSGKAIKVTAKNKRVAKKFMGGEEHFAYTVTMEVQGNPHILKETWHDSIYNYSRGKCYYEEMFNEIVECILLDGMSYRDYPTERAFCDCFGYDEHDVAVFKACKETWESLMELFSEEEIDELSEMVQG